MPVGPLRRVVRTHRRAVRRTAWIAGALILALLLWGNGFHNIGSSSSAANVSCTPADAQPDPEPPQLPDTPRTELPDPTDIEGRTTAYTQTSAIAPVDSNPELSQRLPATVDSDDGPQQTVTDTSRILALNQNGGLASAVVGLGLGCNLIGRDTATNIEGLMPGSGDLPLVTQNGHELNAEAILDLAPTVIITDTSIGPYDTQLQLRDAGVPVVFIPLGYEQGVHGVAAQVQAVGDALGLSELGERLAERTNAEISQTIQAIGSDQAPTDQSDKPRIVFLYLRGSIYYWFGRGSGADTLIQAIGARDVATEVGFDGMSPTNSEALVKAAPDVIIVMTLGLESVGGVEEAIKLPGIRQTPAGQNGRLVDMSDYEVMSFGPRTASVLAALSTAVYDPENSYQPEHGPEAVEMRVEEIREDRAQEGDGA
jgi:iron complex transport system substrate-binding protein